MAARDLSGSSSDQHCKIVFIARRGARGDNGSPAHDIRNSISLTIVRRARIICACFRAV